MVKVSGSVNIRGAALGHHGDLSAGVAAVFRLVLAAEHFELCDRIRADGDVLAAIGAGVDIADTVDGELVHRSSVAVHIYATEPADTADRNVGHAEDAGNQLRHVERISSVDLDVVDLLADDGFGTLHALRLKQGRGSGYFNRLGHRADRHGQIAERQFVLGIERNINSFQFFESRGQHFYGVITRRKTGQRELARVSRLGDGIDPLVRFHRSDGGVADHGTLLVYDTARHGPCDVLRIRLHSD